MSQYDRHGAGMNCGGRNQFDITKDDLRELREHFSKRTDADATSERHSEDAEKMRALSLILDRDKPLKEAYREFFEKYPDERILTAGGFITKNGFDPIEQ